MEERWAGRKGLGAEGVSFLLCTREGVEARKIYSCNLGSFISFWMEDLVPRGLIPGQSSLQGVWWKLWIWISWFAYPSCAGRWLFLPLRINTFGRNLTRSARPKFWASRWQKIMSEFMSSCYIHLCVCLSAPHLPWFRLCRIPNHAYTAPDCCAL